MYRTDLLIVNGADLLRQNIKKYMLNDAVLEHTKKEKELKSEIK